MDHDDDVEHLFSWLQTPELRYREFAGAREITDTVVAWQGRPTPAPAAGPPAEVPEPADGDGEFGEEYPSEAPLDADSPWPEGAAAAGDADLLAPDAGPEIPAATDSAPAAPPTRGPALFAPVLPPVEPAAAHDDGLFALGAAGRTRQLQTPTEDEPLVPPPLIQTPPQPAAAAPRAPAATAGGGLLGGAYRENGANGHAANGKAAAEPAAALDTQKRSERSLDAVFGRLSGSRARAPVSHGRLHIPGFAPPDGRPR